MMNTPALQRALLHPCLICQCPRPQRGLQGHAWGPCGMTSAAQQAQAMLQAAAQ